MIVQASSDPQLVTVTIDKRVLQAPAGTMILQLARQHGIEIPSLCDHEGLEPQGACRLCLVEISHPQWPGWHKVVTACLYPIEDGLVIDTQSPQVVQARQVILELLLSRAPQAPVVRALAQRYGVEQPRYPDPSSNCILCNLCVRVCHTYSTGAIATMQRGILKEVAPPLAQAPVECVGCGACATICPVDHIPWTREHGVVQIWSKEFQLAYPVIDAAACTGCGVCEEICPFSIPRVVVQRDGSMVVTINQDYCRGCGLCVAVCPSGALDQQYFSHQQLNRGQATTVQVMSCTRSPWRTTKNQILKLPCTGRITTTMLLDSLIQGSQAILVLGRSQEHCAYHNGETTAQQTIAQANALAQLVGLGTRIYWRATQGQDGPANALAALESTMANLPPNPLLATPAFTHASGHQALRERLAWLRCQTSLQPDRQTWLTAQKLPCEQRPVVLYTGCVPVIDILYGPVLPGWEVRSWLLQALALLEHWGMSASIFLSAGACTHGGAGGWEHDRALLGNKTQVITLCPDCAQALQKHGGIPACSLDQLVLSKHDQLSWRALKLALPADHPAVEVLASHLITMTQARPLPLEQAHQMRQYLQQAASEGATHLLVPTPAAWAYQQYLTRPGSWRQVHLEPILLHQLVQVQSSQ